MPSVSSPITLARKAGLLDDPETRRKFKMLLTILIASGDEALIEDFERALELKALNCLIDPFHRGLRKAKYKGFYLGEAEGRAVFMNEEHLKKNVLILGESGSGKTNLILNLMLQLLKHEITFWAFDFKRDYRALLPYAKALDKELLVIRWESLKFNPLKPPLGVSIKHWAQQFKRIFGHSQGLWLASQSFLGEHLFTLYDLYDCFEHNQKMPSLFELKEIIHYSKVRPGTPSMTYKDRLLNRLKDMLMFEGSIFDCSQDFIQALIDKNVIFELDGMSPKTQAFLVELLMAYLYEFYKMKGQTSSLKKVLVFDEAKHVFDLRKQFRLKDERPYVDEIAAQSRAYGIGLIVADQEPSELTNSIKANSSVKIQLQLGSGKDIEDSIRALGLNSEQKEESHLLGVGKAIVKFTGLPPLKVNIPLVEMLKVSDGEVNVPSSLEEEVLPRVQTEAYSKFIASLAAPKADVKPSEDPIEAEIQRLTPEAKALLISIGEDPFKPLATRYLDLKMSAYTGNKAKAELIRNHLAKEVEIGLGKGGRPKFLELTPKGEFLLENLGVNFAIPGKGSFEHKFWQNKIADFYREKTPHVFIEWEAKNGFIDIFVVDHLGKKIGVEVSLNAKAELSDIQKLLDEDLDERIVVCKNKKVLQELKDLASAKFKDISKIRFCLLDDFPIK